MPNNKNSGITMKNSHKIVILNNKLVRKKLRQKKHDDVCLTSWGHLDEFINFIISFGIVTMLSQLGVQTGHSGIPYYILTMMAFIKPLFGIRFDDNIKYLSQDRHVLRLLGFNLKSIKEGYSKRTKNDDYKPIHPNTLRNFLCKLGYKQTTGLHVKCVRKLFQLGLIRGHSFCTDTKIIFKDSPGYEFAKKVYDYKGKHTNRRGYKVSIIQHIKSKIIVAVIITSANVSDKNLLLTTVRQAVTVLGPDVIKTLVFDKGYWDGKTLNKLKQSYGIDFIIPAKANFLITKRLKEKAKEEDFETINPGLKIKHVTGITDAPNYKNNLQAIVVKDKKAKKKRKTHQPVHVYITSLSWESALAVYQGYRERWVIENNAIKELCQYWVLEDFHCTKFNAIRAHIMFSIVMFNLHILFKSKYGRRFKEKSLAAKRAPGFQPSYVIVYCDNYFGIFDIQEYTEILSEPP
jgi:hypothetical protein